MNIVEGQTSGAIEPDRGTGSEQAKTPPSAVQPGAAEVEQSPGAADERDRVELSELSQKLSEAISGDSAERAARLEQLAAAVQAGRYQVDPLAVSRRIVDEALKGE